MLWLVLLLAVLLIYWIYDIYYNGHQYRLGKDIPGYKRWPIIGSAHVTLNMGDAHKFFVKTGELASQHGGVYALWLGPQLVNFLTDANDVEIVLSKCLGKPFQYVFFNEVAGSGLITLLDVAEWKRHRKIIQPSFNVQILNHFIHEMHTNSMQLVKSLESETGKGMTDITYLIGKSVLDNLHDVFVDFKSDELFNKVFQLPITQLEAEISSAAFNRMIRVWLWWDAVFYRTLEGKKFKRYQDSLHEYTSQVFFRKRDAITKNVNGEHSRKLFDSTSRLKEKCFLNSLILDGPQLTDDEIIKELRTLLLAGFDTTTAFLSFILMLVGSYPDVQKKLYEELSSIYQGSNRPIIKEDLAKMTYLEYAIKEALRLYPPVTTFGRKIEYDVKLTNCTLPAGSIAYIVAWTIQRDEKIWGPDASEFKPERWMTKRKHPCSFIPFSHGSRNCIGIRYAMMSSKITIANILRNFKIIADISTAEIIMDITIKPRKGCRIELIKRNH